MACPPNLSRRAGSSAGCFEPGSGRAPAFVSSLFGQPPCMLGGSAVIPLAVVFQKGLGPKIFPRRKSNSKDEELIDIQRDMDD